MTSHVITVEYGDPASDGELPMICTCGWRTVALGRRSRAVAAWAHRAAAARDEKRQER